jgi:methionine aminotransferase
MSAMATQHGAINLSQGFPDFPVDEELVERINFYYREGKNQYAPMPGVPALLDRLCEKHAFRAALPLQADMVTITPGATAALYTAIATLLQPGDEAIVLEPCYDSYIPAIEVQGARAVRVALRSDDYSVPWNEVEAALTERTRMIIINSPHNPTGSVLREEDLNRLAAIVRDTPITILSDEVYEHIIFDGLQHQSVLHHPELCHRSIAVYSFGKTFHATGWKVGYMIAPSALMKELRKVHQYMVFSVHTPLQYALADYLESPEPYLSLPAFYAEKRDFFMESMKTSRFKAIPSKGTYFQLMSYADISDRPDREMAEWLTREHGVAAIPLSPFFADGRQDGVLRFCFAKSEITLQKAADILCKI